MVGGWGGESFVTPPTGKSCFVFALRACVRATRREISVVSRHVFVPAATASPAPAAASWYCKTLVKSLVCEQVV